MITKPLKQTISKPMNSKDMLVTLINKSDKKVDDIKEQTHKIIRRSKLLKAKTIQSLAK